MKAERLSPNGTIGIFCPSHIADKARYERISTAIERLGFKVKFGANIEKDTYGYAASAEERAEDLNVMVLDDTIQMILFSGGESAVEILPYINYKNICKKHKLFSSYSDGTSILNAIYSQTGLETYYGFGAGQFEDLRYYDYMQFCSNFVDGYQLERFEKNSKWKTLNNGIGEGILIGGYTSLFGLMLSNKYFKYDSNKKYLLILEDHECFSHVGAVSTYLAFIEQSDFMKNVTGLIFGHYSVNLPESLLNCLERIGKRNNIPVIYTDDFGHGINHAVLPIGKTAILNANNQSLCFCD